MIYLDNAATTRPDAAILAPVFAHTAEQFYNPSARYGESLGVAAELKRARESILSTVADVRTHALVFTSGGTEADNLALFSARRGNVVTTAGEHAAVYRSAMELKSRGIDVRFAPIDGGGAADPDALLSLVDEKTSLVSVVHVNNETGAINDIAEIARRVKEKNPRTAVHSDGVQAYGKLAFRLPDAVDLYSVSAHKIGGLKGTGALIKKRPFTLPPLLHGGGQEGGLRSGTENVFGILAFGKAAAEQFKELVPRYERTVRLRDVLWAALDKEIFFRISPEAGSPYLLSVSAAGLRGEVLQRMLDDRGVIVGTGSACSSKNPHSRVIEACGYTDKLADGVLRVSFSKDTTEQEVLQAAAAMNGTAKELMERLNR